MDRAEREASIPLADSHRRFTSQVCGDPEPTPCLSMLSEIRGSNCLLQADGSTESRPTPQNIRSGGASPHEPLSISQYSPSPIGVGIAMGIESHLPSIPIPIPIPPPRLGSSLAPPVSGSRLRPSPLGTIAPT